MNIDFQAIKRFFTPYFQDLNSFEFSVLNPLFWVLMVLIFLLLLRIWEARKSLSFCVIVGAILLASTKLKDVIATQMYKHGATVDTALIKIVSVFIIGFVSIIYFFLKE